MVASRTSEFLHRLQKGIKDPEDIAMLEQTPASQLVDELRSHYRFTFQERRIGNKWELALARTLQAESVDRPVPDAVSGPIVPAYLECLMLNIEDNCLTGISRLTRLTVWAVREPQSGFALKSGRGFKLDRTPDGWEIKSLRNRVVKLSRELLQERGWQFDLFKQFLKIPESSLAP